MRRLLAFIFCLSIASSVFAFDGAHGFTAEPTQGPGVRKIRPRTKKEVPARSSPELAARREAIHEMMLKGEYQHDGSEELYYIGDMSSVPALLQVLKDNPPTIMPDGRSIGICTISHAYGALVKITGNKESKSYEEWSAWWEQYQKEHPQKVTAPPKRLQPTPR